MYKGHSSSPAVCMCVLGPWRRGLRLSIFLHVTGSSVCRSDVITLWFQTLPISTLPCVIDFQKKLMYRIALFNFAVLCTMTKTFWFFRCQENFKFSPLFAHGCRKKKVWYQFPAKTVYLLDFPKAWTDLRWNSVVTNLEEVLYPLWHHNVCFLQKCVMCFF